MNSSPLERVLLMYVLEFVLQEGEEKRNVNIIMRSRREIPLRGAIPCPEKPCPNALMQVSPTLSDLHLL
jgi:hypothetical protein